ncbi:MAG: cyclodeaminase/cyclohydrolase family protein [Candidatus Omnitrophica bacterium]|nr:cyclodeaminase/cyclohydrolase family protein [Candidatus Omnitrophota bacterium]MCK5288880.1 cyclodeaminase/cyclohydrolase family protein [Candidatus Omnitrophota bacterium]MCK5492102.1 cyclodeaminase/cyclohydrolase family protein [Candidatus Omnitrophota bacterium]
MKKYKSNFKDYIHDLGKREPSPGGGSAVCVAFCMGASLMEKAVNYSLNLKKNDKKTIIHNKKLKTTIIELQTLKKGVFPYIDKDGYIFEKIIKTKGEKKEQFIEQSEFIIYEVATACENMFCLAKKIESGIKKSIESDFIIGLELVRTALLGCILNLEANSKISGKKNKSINKFKKSLNKWQKY